MFNVMEIDKAFSCFLPQVAKLMQVMIKVAPDNPGDIGDVMFVLDHTREMVTLVIDGVMAAEEPF